MKVREVLITTSSYGWNVAKGMSATRFESYHNPKDVCMCEYCADNPHYGAHYCKRYGEPNYRFYSDHRELW